jgi:2-polyprenyl-6-methoxyphenol hydroxylase-like FAD-dependent oxidoreductase
MTTTSFDVIIVGGGIAGSTLGGVLARAGLGVLVVERETRFRDRIRGEGTWPWGVAEARAADLQDLLERASVVELHALTFYEHGEPASTDWDLETSGGVPGIGFSHPRFQEAAFTWAAAHGATTLRPAKATRFSLNGGPSLTVTADERDLEYRARLVVGADGKTSMARRWTGGASMADPEHHRMGGVLLSGATFRRKWDNVSWAPGEAVNWFAAGAEMTRLYLVMSAQRLRETSIDRSFEALVAFAAERMPEGALAQVQQEGPIGFFPNNDTWATCIAGNRVVLIGDAAGSPDPTQGHGTSLLFHDIRHLGELLLSTSDWDAAIEEFAARRRRAFAAVNAWDCWNNIHFDVGEEADRLRAGNERARAADPTLGGWALIETHGPDGLVPDDAARRAFFGETL